MGVESPHVPEEEIPSSPGKKPDAPAPGASQYARDQLDQVAQMEAAERRDEHPEDVLEDFTDPSDFMAFGPGEAGHEPLPEGFQILNIDEDESLARVHWAFQNPDSEDGNFATRPHVPFRSENKFGLSDFVPEEYHGLSMLVHCVDTQKMHLMIYQDGKYVEMRGGRAVGGEEKQFPAGMYTIVNIRSQQENLPDASPELLARISQEPVRHGYESYDPEKGHELYYVDPYGQRLTHISPSGKIQAIYDISTGEAGLGNENGSGETSTGLHVVGGVYGESAKFGEVFRSRRQTGSVARVSHSTDDMPDDKITTRVVWLDGAQEENSNAKSRYIYMHGTPEELRNGSIYGTNEDNEPRGTSHGCVRTGNWDIAEIVARMDPKKAYIYIDATLQGPNDTLMASN